MANLTEEDQDRTCSAIDLLSGEEKEALLDADNGYLSLVDSSLTNLKENDARKKTLILDVDNTLIFVKHFMDEMRVGDKVKLGDVHAVVVELTYKLELEFQEGGMITTYDHVITEATEPVPARGDAFPDEISKVAVVHQADPTGCQIHVTEDPTNQYLDAMDGNVKISFLDNSEELNMLEPNLTRDGFLPVDFMYGGYLVRIRPGLSKFLEAVNKVFDIVLFTAADGYIYQGLLEQVHKLLSDDLNLSQDKKLWSQILFRADCDEKYDEYGQPYRHKDLTKVGRSLDSLIMVDDNPLCYKGFEPNCVRVKSFSGRTEPADDELATELLPTLLTAGKHDDVRYHLSGFEPPANDGRNDEEIEPQPIAIHVRRRSSKYLSHLRDALQKESETAEENGRATRQSLSRSSDDLFPTESLTDTSNGGRHRKRESNESSDFGGFFLAEDVDARAHSRNPSINTQNAMALEQLFGTLRNELSSSKTSTPTEKQSPSVPRRVSNFDPIQSSSSTTNNLTGSRPATSFPMNMKRTPPKQSAETTPSSKRVPPPKHDPQVSDHTTSSPSNVSHTQEPSRSTSSSGLSREQQEEQRRQEEQQKQLAEIFSDDYQPHDLRVDVDSKKRASIELRDENEEKPRKIKTTSPNESSYKDPLKDDGIANSPHLHDFVGVSDVVSYGDDDPLVVVEEPPTSCCLFGLFSKPKRGTEVRVR